MGLTKVYNLGYRNHMMDQALFIGVAIAPFFIFR